MGNHNGDNVEVLKVEETRTSEPTVEIKVKTLDSQTYTLRVDKCVPVPTLKEQIAVVTGILSEQQRLICRGRVLKDDQLLSAYHVEDGHTLHLVVREPIVPSESISDPSASAADTQTASGGPRVVIGTFNISDQTQGGMPDISQILSAFLGSLDRNGSAIDGNREPPALMIHRTATSSGLVDSIRRQPVSVSSGGQHASQRPSSVPSRGHLYPPVIPDSLTTLSQYLNQITDEFALANGAEENSSFPGSPPFDEGFNAPDLLGHAYRRGMPTASSLAEVLQSTRQLLINQTAESLSRLATQLRNQVNVTDASARMSIQSNAMRSGIIFRNLGALLLELGRTTMMLRMGEIPADAVVNAGPAVFINEYGPNPIMVQPFPMGSELSGAGLGSSFLPNNVDIRMRTGTANQGEQTSQQQSQLPASQASTEIPPTASLRHAEVLIRPIRAVFGTVPVHATQTNVPSRGANGIVFPVMSRVQPPANTSDARSSTSAGNVDGRPGAGNARPASPSQYYEGLNSSFDEYLQNMFNIVNEQLPPQTAITNTNNQPTMSAGASDSASQTDPAPSDEGIFLSNLLHQIMPHISQISATGSAAGPSSAGDNDGQGNMEHGTANERSSLRRQSDEPSSSEAKRQKR